jgi:hypothetical protein
MAVTLAGQSDLLLKGPAEPGWESLPASVHGVTVYRWPLNPGKASHPFCTCGTATKVAVAAMDPQPRLAEQAHFSVTPNYEGMQGLSQLL